jgi:hypothetical protein
MKTFELANAMAKYDLQLLWKVLGLKVRLTKREWKLLLEARYIK